MSKINQSLSFLQLKSKPPTGKILRCPSSASAASAATRSSSRASSQNISLKSVKGLRITASAFCVLDSQTGWVLASRRDSEMREIASLTKIMTCYTVIQLVSKNIVSYTDVVKISKQASKVSGTSADLNENDEILLLDLLYGLMLPSGNDAAWALAEHCGKKLSSGQPVQNFLSEMNSNCKKIQLNYTFFRNPHGMAVNKNLSTARDVCKLSQVALKIEKFGTIVSTKSHMAFIKNEGKVRVKTWENTNKMLQSGYVGVKTGITSTAGPCLCSSFGNIIIVLLNSRSMEDRWRETEALLNLVQDM